jgi:hypothetical protein
MPTCIYCRLGTAGDEPEDHPLPQALGTGAYPLPKGDVCRSCNPYLSGLDHNLCDHHHLAGMIVFGHLPGTDDRIRRTIAPGLAFDAERQHMTVRAKEASVSPRQLVVRDPGNLKFDSWKFSRGLHRVALGMLGLRAGAATALDSRYDLVRQYIRQPPSRRTFWPYWQRVTDKVLGNRTFPPALRKQGFKFGFSIRDDATYAYMNLFVDEFIVALHGDAHAASDDEEQQFALASGFEEQQLSRRPWLLFKDATAGRELTVTPEWFANANLGLSSAPSTPDELPDTNDNADTDDHP